MKPAPTLIDEIYRTSFHRQQVGGWKSNIAMRNALHSARRFIADEPTSRFMADLANQAFLKTRKKPEFANRLCDSLRVQSRLPHEGIWIEYFMRPYQHRAHEMMGTAPPIDEQIGYREGWLIQQHPKIETACIMHVFVQGDDIIKTDDGFTAWTYPFAFGWCCDDSPLPWRKSIAQRIEMTNIEEGGRWGNQKRHSLASAFLVGLFSYDRENVGCVHSPLIQSPLPGREDEYTWLLQEWIGVVRRVWALLATIDNLPITRNVVRQSRGFLGRGQIRKFLNHTTITLNIPAHKDTRVLARKMIAIVHRKRHEVRGHWREDFRHPTGKCNPHVWEPVGDNVDLIECDLCHGRQIYVHKHERGDASLGYVTHDYKLTHEVQP